MPKQPTSLLVALFLAGIAGVQPVTAILIPGGQSKRTDCFAELEVEGAAAVAGRGATRVSCVDGDIACDQDGSCESACRVRIRLCLSQQDPGLPQCAAGSPLRSAKARVKGGSALEVPNLGKAGCGGFLEVDVPVKRRGKKLLPGATVTAKAVVDRKHKDTDRVDLLCLPREGACPVCGNGVREDSEQCDDGNADDTDTCTNRCRSARCGDGIVEAGVEQCDPPGTATCGAGAVCDVSCQCTACDCCGYTQLAFTTGSPTGRCGVLSAAAGPIADLQCGGLYFGGGLASIPLPAITPDAARFIVDITSCDSRTGEMSLGPTTAAETGDVHTCSSAGCSFGAPIPIPNAMNAPTSVCIVPMLSADTVGTGNCVDGSVGVTLAVAADVFAAGDILPGTAGIQPCPLCTGGTCKGGPNDGAACTPAGSDLGDAYPTSRDCPPDPAQFSGVVALQLGGTTATASSAAGPSGSQQRVFCGFCRDVGSTGSLCFAGDPDPGGVRGCPAPLGGSVQPCGPNAACSAPYETCEQRDNGAFGRATAKTISESGTAAVGCLADGATHGATFAGIYCVPPTFNGLFDMIADLPGPGAASVPVTVQLLR